MDRSLISKKIFDLLKQQPGRPFKPRALFRKSGLAEKHYKAVKGVLEELYREGKVQKRARNLYLYRRGGGQQTGRLVVTQRGFGFVEVEGQEQDLFIRERDMGTALHQDIVRVEITRKAGDNRNPQGRVKEVVKRGRSDFVGVFIADRHGQWVAPDDRRIRVRFTVPPHETRDARPGQVVRVELLHWYDSDPEPVGRVAEILGNPGDPGLDVLKITREFDLPTEWSAEAEAQAEAFSVVDIEKEIAHRLDLRKLDCFTIDPADAKDFDDAVSLERLDNGWRLGVHIADVSHFVPPGSPLDREARERGTSVYLVGQAVHMLPENLAGNLCSLVPDRDRLTMSCIMDLDHEGQVRKVRIEPSVIRSKRRFTYQEVQSVLDVGKGDFAAELKDMEGLRQVLRQKRKDAGSIDLDIPEPVFQLNEAGLPVEIKASERLASHMLIEEFMLLANRCVAERFQYLEEKRRWPGIYRTHAAPQRDDIRSFKRILKQLEIPVPDGSMLSPRAFQGIVESVRESPFRYFIERLALRSMTKARYSCDNVGHFGLAFEWYTHFTSPIRRYPDLQVHRLLKLYAKPGKQFQPPNTQRLMDLAAHCSRREEVAVEAERAHLKIKQLQYLAGRIGEEFDGVISGVIGFGFFVELAETLVEGFVHLNTLKDDWYEFLDEEYTLLGRRTRKRYRLGDQVRIRVAAVNVEEGFADFSLLASGTQDTE